MSLPIGDYALIGDTHTTALVSSQGSIDWWCWARHDAPALLTKLLDDADGGCADIALDDARGVSRNYVPDTNILETHFAGPRGRATLTDCMALFERAPGSRDAASSEPQDSLVRQVACTDGTVRGRFVFRFTPDYGRATAEPFEVSTNGCAIRIADGPTLYVESAHPVVVHRDRIVVAFALAAAERASVTVGLRSSPVDESLERHLAVLTPVARTAAIKIGRAGTRRAPASAMRDRRTHRPAGRCPR